MLYHLEGNAILALDMLYRIGSESVTAIFELILDNRTEAFVARFVAVYLV